MSRPTVVGAGFHGMQNFGDDLFRSVLMAKASRIWPGADLRFSSPDPGSQSWPGRLYRRNDVMGTMARIAHAGYATMRGDVIAYCGGSILSDVRGTRRVHKAGERLGFVRLEAIGVSFGPFSHKASEERVRAFAEHLDRIIVRDPASAHWLTTAGLPHRLGGDIAGLLAASTTRPEGTSSRVTIAPCSTAGAYGRGYENGVLNAVRTLHARRRDLTFTVLALNNHPVHGDGAVSEQLARRLSAEGLTVETRTYAQLGVQGAVDLISGSIAVIATRLHAGIVAYLADVPTLLVAYHRKGADFADDIGLPSAHLLKPNDEPPRWIAGAESLHRSKPLLPPDAYRRRAVEAYCSGWNRA